MKLRKDSHIEREICGAHPEGAICVKQAPGNSALTLYRIFEGIPLIKVYPVKWRSRRLA